MRGIKLLNTLFLSVVLLISIPAQAGSIWSPMTDIVNSGIINSRIVGNNSFSNVDATVDNGIAIFTGSVSSRTQVDQLIRIAHSISGIRGVDVSGLRVGRE